MVASRYNIIFPRVFSLLSPVLLKHCYFISHFQPASVLVFYISAILLSGYAIQTSTPALAPTKITFGHDNNKIQGSLYSEDGVFIPKSLHRKMQGPKPRAGLRTLPEGQKQRG